MKDLPGSGSTGFREVLKFGEFTTGANDAIQADRGHGAVRMEMKRRVQAPAADASGGCGSMNPLEVFAIAALVTCAFTLSADARQPAYECHAQRTGDRYVFSATSTPRFPSADGRVALSMLEVRLPGRFVWGIRADDAETKLVDAVTYGETPAGYSQYVPERRKPEPLRTGRVYDVTCGAGTGAFLVTTSGIEALVPDDPRALVRPCSCPPSDSLFADFNKSAAVFVGQAVADEPPTTFEPPGESYRKVTFAVSKWVKGSGKSRAIVMNGPLGAGVDCAFDFEEDREYLVFAQSHPSTSALVVDRCSRSAFLDDNARRELLLLENAIREKRDGEPGHALDARKDARK